MWKILKRLREERRGSVMILVAGMMSMLLALGALVTDLGVVYLERARVVTALDLSAHSAAQVLPQDQAQASTIAATKLSQNGVDPAVATITLADTRTLTISYEKNVGLGLGRIFGMDAIRVRGTTQAMTENLYSYATVWPVAVETGTLTINGTIRFEVSQSGWAPDPGYLKGLGIGSNNRPIWVGYLSTGMSMAAGSSQPKVPGNESNAVHTNVQNRINSDPTATYLSFRRATQRLVIVPILTSITGGNSPVTVWGFAAIFLESSSQDGTGNRTYVTGRVVRFIAEGVGSNTLAPELYVYTTKIKQ